MIAGSSRGPIVSSTSDSAMPACSALSAAAVHSACASSTFSVSVTVYEAVVAGELPKSRRFMRKTLLLFSTLLVPAQCISGAPRRSPGMPRYV